LVSFLRILLHNAFAAPWGFPAIDEIPEDAPLNEG